MTSTAPFETVSDATAVASCGTRERESGTEREKREEARVIKEEEERRRTRNAAPGREERSKEERRGETRSGTERRRKESVVNECVRCTLFPSPMSEPRLGYFRDIGFERDRERERKSA